MNSGVYARPGVSATVCAAANARRFELAETKASKVKRGSSRDANDSLDSRTRAGPGVSTALTGSSRSSSSSPRSASSSTTTSIVTGWPTAWVTVSAMSWR